MEITRRTAVRSLVGVGGVGLAGCFGGPSGETPTDGQAETDPDPGTSERSPSPTPSEAASSPPPSPTSTIPTVTPEFHPPVLFTLETETVTAGRTTTVNGTLTNEYLFRLEAVEVRLDPPTDEWAVSPSTYMSVGALDPQATTRVSWEVTVPDSARGEYSLTVIERHTSATDTVDVSESHVVSVNPNDTETPEAV